MARFARAFVWLFLDESRVIYAGFQYLIYLDVLLPSSLVEDRSVPRCARVFDPSYAFVQAE
jgi:hypothetical protein